MKYAKITGNGEFPLDMLRYDTASPATEEMSGKIEDTIKNYSRGWEVYVKSESKFPWTVGRWESFGCKIEGMPKNWSTGCIS